MSQENVETTKRFIDAYNRRDVEAMLAEVDPKFEWHSVILTGLQGKGTVYRGHEGVREYLRDLHEALGETHIECSEMRDLGNQLVMIGRFRVRGRESGAGTESPLGAVVDFEAGKGTRLRSYSNVEEALEAAGLSE